jgi:hypothetical protein
MRATIESALQPGARLASVRFSAEVLIDALSDSMIASITAVNPIALHDAYRWAWRMSELALGRLEIENPNQYRDIWEFVYENQTETDDGVWEARHKVRSMYSPTHEALLGMDRRRLARHVAEASTGWPDVDEKIEHLREEFAKADSADDWRDVGRRCDGLMEATGKAVVAALGERLELGAASPKDAGEVATLLSNVATGSSYAKLRKLIREASELAATGGAFVEAGASMLAELADMANATDNFAQQVKHSARTEHQAAIAVEGSIMFASMARHAVYLVLTEDEGEDEEEG